MYCFCSPVIETFRTFVGFSRSAKTGTETTHSVRGISIISRITIGPELVKRKLPLRVPLQVHVTRALRLDSLSESNWIVGQKSCVLTWVWLKSVENNGWGIVCLDCIPILCHLVLDKLLDLWVFKERFLDVLWVARDDHRDVRVPTPFRVHRLQNDALVRLKNRFQI